MTRTRAILVVEVYEVEMHLQLDQIGPYFANVS